MRRRHWSHVIGVTIYLWQEKEWQQHKPIQHTLTSFWSFKLHGLLHTYILRHLAKTFQNAELKQGSYQEIQALHKHSQEAFTEFVEFTPDTVYVNKQSKMNKCIIFLTGAHVQMMPKMARLHCPSTLHLICMNKGLRKSDIEGAPFNVSAYDFLYELSIDILSVIFISIIL